ncbi:hypothetical protein G9A89_000863 [Geosiphon pyriformis]|nr:hypothetical protein G9A89_000863 [Geosiphon pyriformis]
MRFLKREFATNRHLQHSRKETKNLQNNKFKVATTPGTTTLEYYQSIYTHCKQRFNIPDGIEVVKKSVYQYIENCINNYLFENYNISEVRSNLYNNLVHYLQLGTEDLNSETLVTYFQELNFNIIEYCEEKYPTSNKGKQKIKQYSKTTPNTPTLPKTTAKHLQTPEQRTSVKLPLSITSFPISLKPILTSANIIDYLQENESNHSESLESEETEPEPEEATENKEKMATAYIAKILEFMGEDNDTSSQEWLDKVQKAGNANGWIAAKMLKAIPYFLQETKNHLKTGKHSKMLFYNNSPTTIPLSLSTIAFAISNKKHLKLLKDKLIKKVHSHAPADLATAIRHVKSYEMAMKEANHTKLVNLVIGKTSSAAEEKIDQLTKKVESYFTNQQQQQQQPQKYQPPQQCNQNNFGPPSNNQSQNCHYYQQNRSNQCYFSPQSYYQPPPPIYYSPRPQIQNSYYQPAPQPIQQQYQQPLPIQQYQIPPTQQYQVPARRLQRPNHYHTQPSYLTIPEKSDFQQSALSEGEVAASRSNPSNNTILPAQIAQNANLSDIFSFEFEANESPFLLSNAVTNEQKAITAMYTEATLMQQLQRTVDRPAQTVIVTADGMKKTPVEEIDNFPFTINGITILVKVLVIDAPQYQALVRNDWLLKANANLNWETQELKILYQGQYTIVSATCGTFNKRLEKAPEFEFEEEKEIPLTETYMALGSTSNWAEKTEQEIFEESRG